MCADKYSCVLSAGQNLYSVKVLKIMIFKWDPVDGTCFSGLFGSRGRFDTILDPYFIADLCSFNIIAETAISSGELGRHHGYNGDI